MTSRLTARAGVGLKPEHYSIVLDGETGVGWFEVHPENYMCAGGMAHFALGKIRQDYPISLHGVGLSIGGAGRLDGAHLARLKGLVERYQPASFSEHLAWSTHVDIGFANDLLPLPYTDETLRIVCAHIDATQETVGRRMLLENPATYVEFRETAYGEVEFLSEVARRTGCGLLLDVNNVFVSCSNHGWDARAYIAEFPLELVEEIHLAGHAADADAAGERLLIDTHDRRVADPVWDLYSLAIARGGARPTLIEWDAEIPDWEVLEGEARMADRVMAAGVGSCMTKVGDVVA